MARERREDGELFERLIAARGAGFHWPPDLRGPGPGIDPAGRAELDPQLTDLFDELFRHGLSMSRIRRLLRDHGEGVFDWVLFSQNDLYKLLRGTDRRFDGLD